MSRESDSRRLGRTRGDIRCGGLSLRRLAGRLRRWCTGRALNDVPLNNIIFHGVALTTIRESRTCEHP